jgi:hypothetical protein
MRAARHLVKEQELTTEEQESRAEILQALADALAAGPSKELASKIEKLVAWATLRRGCLQRGRRIPAG